MAFSVLLKLKSGEERRKHDFETEEAAQTFAEKEKEDCPSVVSFEVMETSKMSEADKKKGLKPGDPGYTGSEHEDDEDTKKRKKRNAVRKLSEATSEDFRDGHVHSILQLDENGNGRTAQAGNPPHSHEIRQGLVIPMAGEEDDFTYVSYHPGDVFQGSELTADQKKKAAEEAVRKFKESKMKLGELNDVEIFATGIHRGKKFGESEMDEIISNFEKLKEKIKPPMVLGHDEKQEILQNSGLPSLGWALRLSKKDKGNGEFGIVAKLDDVPEVARTAITQGRYKRISPEIYQNFVDNQGKQYGLVLRRIALLGADIPEVKNMADVVNLDETNAILFYCNGSSEGATMPKKDEGALAGNDKYNTDPAVLETIKKLQEENKSLATSLAKEAHEKHVASISSFCEGLKAKGMFLPKWDGMGIQKFMSNLDSQKTLKFAEGDDAKEATTLDFFKELLGIMPKLVKLEEEAVADIDTVAVQTGATLPGVKGVALDHATKEHMAAQDKLGRKLDYGEAVVEVSKARPDLFEE